MWRLPVRHGEMPRSTDERRIGAQHFDAQRGELQLSHLVPRTRIRRAVTLERGLPSVTLVRAREKSQVRRIPVTSHEGVEIVAVPGVLLCVQHGLDGSLRGRQRISDFLRRTWNGWHE